MAASIRTWSAIALRAALCAFALAAGVRESAAQDRPPPKHAHSDLESARERWKQLSPEQREEMRRRFDALKRMSDEERARLHQRFERLGEVQERAVEALPERARRELEALAPPMRREVLREVASERLSEHAEDVLEMMPPHLQQQYRDATPEERPRLVREFGRRLHERARDELLRLGRELDLEPARVEAMLKLDAQELGRQVLELKREAIERAVAKRGLPPFVTAEQWAQLREVRGPEFFRRWGELHGRFGPGPGHRSDREPPPHGRGLEGRGPERSGPEGRDGREGRPHGPPPDGERSGDRPGDRARERGGERDVQAADPVRAERLRRLRDAMRPDPAWFIELSRVDPGERRRVIGERLRERALEFLERAPELANAEQLARLRRESGMRFLEALHELAPELAPPHFGHGRRGPPPGEGDRPPPRDDKRPRDGDGPRDGSPRDDRPAREKGPPRDGAAPRDGKPGRGERPGRGELR